MTPRQIYKSLRDGSGADRELDNAIDTFTPTVEGAEGYVRAYTLLDHAAMWSLEGLADHEWTLPVEEVRDDVHGFAVTGRIAGQDPVTEWHQDKARAICMLAFKLRFT